MYHLTDMVSFTQLAPTVSSGSFQIRPAMSKQFLQITKKYSDTVSIKMPCLSALILDIKMQKGFPIICVFKYAF